MAAKRRSGVGCLVVWLVILAGLLFVFVVYSGVFNVAATYPDIPPVAWTLDHTMTYSVRHHAAGIPVPKLDDPHMIQIGAAQYHGCTACHGAPGVDQLPTLAKGLNPPPPLLADSVKDWKPNELFWITKYGVRMTGMPAWTVTKSDTDIWSIVAFLEQLPGMTPDTYKKLTAPTTPPAATGKPAGK